MAAAKDSNSDQNDSHNSGDDVDSLLPYSSQLVPAASKLTSDLKALLPEQKMRFMKVSTQMIKYGGEGVSRER